MREFHDKRNIRELIYSRYTIILLLILIFIAGKSAFGAYEKYSKSKTAREIVEREVATLEVQEKVTDANLKTLDTPAGEEREIREKFGYVKDGERIVILVEEPASTSSKPRERGFWERFFDIFK